MAVAGNNIAAVKETVETLQETARSAGHTDTSFHAFEVDVTSSKQVNSLFTSLVEKFGRGGRGPPLSVVVNGAGIVRDALLLRQKEAAFDEVINVNLKVSDQSHVHMYIATQCACMYKYTHSFIPRLHSPAFITQCTEFQTEGQILKLHATTSKPE